MNRESQPKAGLASRDSPTVMPCPSLRRPSRSVAVRAPFASARRGLRKARFYWRPNATDEVNDDGACVISITDVDFNYQFEYLGSKERLVVTPLTDRFGSPRPEFSLACASWYPVTVRQGQPTGTAYGA